MSKKEKTANFLSFATQQLAACGYLKSQKGRFAKPVSEDVSLITRFEFVGLEDIEAICYYGTRIESIEQSLSKMKFFRADPIPLSNAEQTIFQRVDKIGLAALDKFMKYSFKLPDEEILKNDLLQELQLGTLEPIFSSPETLSDYCLKDADLPLGHHAFRIPFLLLMTGRESDYELYVSRVAATGFIPDFMNFIEELRTTVEFR